MMNEVHIREAFHRKKLTRHHNNPATLIIDELGLNHGKVRADIAVVNNHYTGYEIKGDNDNLKRLKDQIIGYNSIFDLVYLITTDRHVNQSIGIISKWWGIIIAYQGPRGAINFNSLRSPTMNPLREKMAVTRLLWKNEALELLIDLGVQQRLLNRKREDLYLEIAQCFTIEELQKIVKEYLIKRQGWRDHTLPVQYDG